MIHNDKTVTEPARKVTITGYYDDVVVVGGVAGVAAAAAISDTPALVTIDKLQQELINQGCRLHINELEYS